MTGKQAGSHSLKPSSGTLVDPSGFSDAAAYRAARAAAWAMLLESGQTLTDIANAVGLSRERVRQIIRKEGYDYRRGVGAGRPPDPLAVVRALRQPDCVGLGGLAKRANCSQRNAHDVLQALGLWPAAERLWRKRRRHRKRTVRLERRAQVVREFSAFAKRTGHPPSIDDAIAGELPFCHTTVIRHFGSWSAALAKTGLRTRGPGGR